MKKIQILSPQGDFFFPDYEKINISQEEEGCIITISRSNQKKEVFTCRNHWNMSIISTEEDIHLLSVHLY